MHFRARIKGLDMNPPGEGIASNERSSTFFILIAVCVGAVTTVQARINGELGVRLDDSLLAALISFSTGCAILALATLIYKPARMSLHRLPAEVRSGRLLRWHLLGGIGGAFYILMQVVSVPLLGVALFAILGVAVQAGTALIVDRIGLSPAGKRPASLARIVAAVICWVAVVLAGWDHIGATAMPVMVILGVVLANIGTTVKGAINARVAAAIDSVLAATIVSFALGTAVLAVVYGARLITAGWPHIQPPGNWWLYSGGAIGASALFLAVLCISRVGVLIFGVCGVAGQMCGSLAVDLLSPISAVPVSIFTVVAAGLTLVAIILAAEIGTLKGGWGRLNSVWDFGGDPR